MKLSIRKLFCLFFIFFILPFTSSRVVSTQRLAFYGIALLSIIVVVILLLTLLPGGDDSSSSPQGKSAGHVALENVPLIDGHNNLPAQLIKNLKGLVSTFPFDKDLSTDKKYSWCHSDLPTLKNGMVGTQVWTVNVDCASQYKDAVAKTIQQLDAVNRLIGKYKDDLKLVTSSSDINTVFKDKKIGSFLAIEGGHSMDNRLSTLRLFYKFGVRMMSLTSDCSTPWAADYTESKESKLILTDFGKIVVAEMNRLGMIIDLSLTSTNAQLEVLKQSKAPCIYSTAAANGLFVNARNIKDETFDLIKKNKGLVMISFDGTLLKDSKAKQKVSIDEVIEQINYIREKIGVDHVGLGAGFNADSSSTVLDLENSSKYPKLFDLLAEPKFKNQTEWKISELEQLAGSNFLRVLKDVENVRDSFTEGPYENLIPASDISAADRTCYS